MFPLRVLVIGTGLIGTSIGLAASAAGAQVLLDDVDPRRVELAVSLGAGASRSSDAGGVDVGLVAAPPGVVGALCRRLLEDDSVGTVTHVCSVQVAPLREVETVHTRVERFVGGHPIAGREVSGPMAATAELFADRPWAICPGSSSAADAVAVVEALAVLCRARPVRLAPEAHDRLLASLSHAPQLVASALAATLRTVPSESVGLSGSGFRDTTRLADSEPAMWGQIAAANAPAVAAALREVATPLLDLADVLDSASPAAAGRAVEELVQRGREGRGLLPGKHGGPAVALATVHVVMPDSPGALARLFTDIATAGVNVEDLRVDHAPGQPVGVAEVAVLPRDRDRLLDRLRESGWGVAAGAEGTL